MRNPIKTTVIVVGVALGFPLAVCAQTAASESPHTYVDDAKITAKVKAAILDDAKLKGLEIHVSTYHNVVRLTGSVDSETMIGHATEVARHVSGVKLVHNDLIVK